MNLLRRCLGWPLGPVPISGSAVLILVATVATTARQWSWPYQEWVLTSAAFHEQLLLVAPVAAGAATYYAGRLADPTRVFATPSAARVGFPVTVRHLLTLCTAFIAAYVLGLLPLVVITAARAEAQGPQWLPIIGGLLGLAAAVAVGYAIGALSRSAWLTPLTVVLGFVAMQSTAVTHDQFAAVVPVTHFLPDPGRPESSAISSYRIAFFVLVVLVATALCARAAQHINRVHIPSLATPSLATVGALVLLVLAMGLPMVWRPAILVDAGTARPQVCDRTRRLTYCVHAAHQHVLPEMVAAAKAELALFGGPPGELHRVRDVSLATPSDGDALARGTAWIHLYPEVSTTRSTTTELAQYLSGGNACARRYPNPPEKTPAPILASQFLANTLINRLDHNGSANRQEDGAFHAMSNTRLREWTTQHRTAIAQCTLAGMHAQ